MFNGDILFYFIVAVGLFLMIYFYVFSCRRACLNHNLTNPSHVWQPVPQQPAQNRSFSPFGNLSTQTSNTSNFNRTNFSTSPNAGTIYSANRSRIQTSVYVPSAGQPYNIFIAPSAPQLSNVPSDSHRHINNPLQNTTAIYSGANSNILTFVQVPSALQPFNTLNTPSSPELHNVSVESRRTNSQRVQTPLNSEYLDDLPPDYSTVVLADLAKGSEHSQYPRVTQK